MSRTCRQTDSEPCSLACVCDDVQLKTLSWSMERIPSAHLQPDATAFDDAVCLAMSNHQTSRSSVHAWPQTKAGMCRQQRSSAAFTRLHDAMQLELLTWLASRMHSVISRQW